VAAQPLAAATTAAAVAAPLSPPSILNPQSSILSAEERQTRLTVLADTVKACTRCVLHVERKQTVFARGSGSSGLCFIGEGPGADEDEQGLPFVGAAGQLLDKMIAAMGIERDDVYVCNIVKCRPPKNRTPEPDEMSACMPFLTEQLALIEPQVIVALGKTAVQGLFGTAEGITRIRGRWRLFQGRIAVMPTFHPAYLLRNPAAKREVWTDLQLVLKHLGRALPPKGT
jgi:DNA polymerase